MSVQLPMISDSTAADAARPGRRRGLNLQPIPSRLASCDEADVFSIGPIPKPNLFFMFLLDFLRRTCLNGGYSNLFELRFGKLRLVFIGLFIFIFKFRSV